MVAGVIVTCPNCQAQYRLNVTVVAARRKLKCAACDHRWVPQEAVDEDEEFAAVQAELQAPPPPPPPEPAPPAPDPEPAPEPEPERRGSPVAKTVIAVVLGAALTAAAAGLWVGQVDPAAIPLVGDRLASLGGTSSALKVEVRGAVSTLATGAQVLEVTGRITNPTRSGQPVPALEATLAGPGGVARRWRIEPEAVRLAPGQSVGFVSNVTDVPEDATRLSVSFAR